MRTFYVTLVTFVASLLLAVIVDYLFSSLDPVTTMDYIFNVVEAIIFTALFVPFYINKSNKKALLSE